MRRHPFYKISVLLCKMYMGCEDEKKRRRRLREKLCSLSPLEQPANAVENFYIEGIEKLLVMICAGIIITVSIIVSGQAVGRVRTCATAFLMMLALALLTPYSQEAELDKKVKKRDNQLEIDYPEIVHKMTLLLLAGITTKEAWEKITLAYVQRRKQGEGKRYAYEEMLLTYREMEGGMTEAEAYDRFGRRCRLAGYLKLSGLLNQNIRTGSSGLLELLTYEGVQAMEERKNLAKRLGEEASTKLLFPMMLMLLVVIVILIVPALMTIQF